MKRSIVLALCIGSVLFVGGALGAANRANRDVRLVLFDSANVPAAGVSCIVMKTPENQRRILLERTVLSCSQIGRGSKELVVNFTESGIVVFGPPVRANGNYTTWLARTNR